MNHPRLRSVLLAALTAGMGTGVACSGGTVGSPTDDTATVDDTGEGHTGTPPATLAEVCAADSLLGFFSITPAPDYLSLRSMDGYDETAAQTERETWGTACANASDATACTTTLADTWPSMAGWGYCGEGCTNYGLVWTRGDEVGLAETPAQVAAFFGDIDVPAEALFLALASDYTAECLSLVEAGDGWELEANYLTSDCPWTTEDRRIGISASGELSVLETLKVNEDGACAGRRPDGLGRGFCVVADAVGAHLATLARLEAAAVVAFERLAVELDELGAPSELASRARKAARDEVRHAKMMRALARKHGVHVPDIEVQPVRERSFVAFARENAVEGCVRETFGVADAAWRAQHAPTPALRAVFARIARDEARHAELAWDIAAWAATRLSAEQSDQLRAEMSTAWAELCTELRGSRPDAVQVALGAPSAEVAVQMATSMAQQLAA